MPVIYQEPKVHKNQTDPPGRGIVSGVDSLFSRMGEYIDHYLQPLAQQFPSYLRDRKQLINILDNFPYEENVILVTLDVDSLYTNIRQDDVLRDVEWTFNRLLGIPTANFYH